MRKSAFVIAAAVSAASMALVGCDVRKTQEGNVDVPKYEVSKTQEGNVQMPKYDVTTPDVSVSSTEKKVTVPDVDINSKEATVTLPKVDITPADEKLARQGKSSDDQKKQ